MLNEILTPDEIEFLHLAWNSIFAPCIVVLLISWLLELAFKIARNASICHDDEVSEEAWEQMHFDAYTWELKRIEELNDWLERFPHMEQMRERVIDAMVQHEYDLDYHRRNISPFSNHPIKYSA